MAYTKNNHVPIVSDSPTTTDDMNAFGSQHEEFYDAFTSEHTIDGIHVVPLLPRGRVALTYTLGVGSAHFEGNVLRIERLGVGVTKVVFASDAPSINDVWVTVVARVVIADIATATHNAVAYVNTTNSLTVYTRDEDGTPVDLGFDCNIWYTNE